MFLRKLPAGESLRYIYVGHISIFTVVFLPGSLFSAIFPPPPDFMPFLPGHLGHYPKV